MDKNQMVQKSINEIDPNIPVNLVLSGGGVKGVAHIALIERLEEHGIKIKAISGSSAGALVGVLYAAGYAPPEILEFFKITPIFKYTWLNPLKAGIFDSAKYEAIFEQLVPENFELLEIPLFVTSVNIEKGTVVYFNQGSLIKPILASCAVPAVFTPVTINDELFSDGGVMDNFPIKPFLNSNDPIIGSYVACPRKKQKDELNTILKVSQHSNSLLLHAANKYKFEKIDLTIKFPLGNYSTYDTKKIDAIYLNAVKFLDESVQKKIKSKRLD